MVVVRSRGVVEAQKVELDAEKLGDQLAEAIEKHLRRDLVGRQQGREAVGLPRRQREEGLQVGQDAAARHQQRAAKVGRAGVVEQLLEGIDAVGRRSQRAVLDA